MPEESFTATTGTQVGHCTSQSIPRALLPQSCLDLMTRTGWWADILMAQSLMDSSSKRRTASSSSIIRDQSSHRLTESMTAGLSVVGTSMVPELPTDSWLGSPAHRRHKQRGRK